MVQGYDDGTYKPNQGINRAEFLKILMESADISPQGVNCFSDVADQWFAGYVCEAQRQGIVQGYEDGTFGPVNPINFAEASKIVVNTLEIERSGEASFDWYEDFVLALEANGAILENIYHFGQPVTRGQMAEIIWRLQEKPEDVTTAKFDDLDLGMINVPSEAAVPDDIDILMALDAASDEQRVN